LDLTQYQTFVESVISDPSKHNEAFLERFNELTKNTLNVNIPMMMTSADGLGAEAGEYTEIVKKILYQGKPLDEANRFHMMRELGDVLFYWTMAVTALGYNPQEVLDENHNKLTQRYPDGFDVSKSENRKANDI